MIRPAVAGDYPALATIFYDAVHIGAAKAYSRAERQAWLPHIPEAEALRVRMSDTLVLVADMGEGPKGFMSLTDQGVVDMAYVHPDVNGQGVGFGLYQVIEKESINRKIHRLSTFASHVAKPFFLRQGWQVLRPNQVERRGVVLGNWAMERFL